MYGEDPDFDLSFAGGDLTNGKSGQVKCYTASMIDLIAIWDRTTDRCFYVPATELGAGKWMLHLRLSPAQNGQQARTRNAEDHCDLPGLPVAVEPAGFEPATSRMQTGRSPS